MAFPMKKNPAGNKALKEYGSEDAAKKVASGFKPFTKKKKP